MATNTKQYIRKQIPAGEMGDIVPDFTTIKYGELVQYVRPGGYHTGVKVHFFNQKGVLIGNYYHWVPYNELRYPLAGRRRERVFYGSVLEKPKQAVYELCCAVITVLIRITQKMSR